MKLGHVAIGILVLVAGAAQARDDKVCPVGLICASRPETVVAALQAAGYKAQLGKDNQGDPSITSAAAGYDFDILFYGCEEHLKCDSLQFRLTFGPYENHTPDLANLWNRDKRLLKAEARPDRRLASTMTCRRSVGSTRPTSAIPSTGGRRCSARSTSSSVIIRRARRFRRPPPDRARPNARAIAASVRRSCRGGGGCRAGPLGYRPTRPSPRRSSPAARKDKSRAQRRHTLAIGSSRCRSS